MKVFADYARYYDLIYQEKDYSGESGFVYQLIKKHVPKARTVLELGCGTGMHAQHLAESGLDVYGIDFSKLMLEKAQARLQALPAELARKLSFSWGDARELSLGKTFDVVIALFHVMSYQVSNEDLKATLLTAKEHLRPDGVFIFDYWYGPAVLREWPSVRVKRVEDEGVSLVRLAEPVIHVNENLVEVNYQVFMQDKSSGVIESFRECHRMRYLFQPEIDLLFANARLTPLEHGEWMTGRTPGFNTWSAYSIGRK